MLKIASTTSAGYISLSMPLSKSATKSNPIAAKIKLVVDIASSATLVFILNSDAMYSEISSLSAITVVIHAIVTVKAVTGAPNLPSVLSAKCTYK